MSGHAITALPAVGALIGAHDALAATAIATPPTIHPDRGFAAMIEQGIAAVDAKAKAADQAVRAFVLDDSVPVHQVSFALGQAQLSLELMLQIRGRLVEGYQQLMNMQL